MAEIVVTPEGRDAIQVGSLIDDDGARFVAMSFERPNDHRAVITLTPELFRDFAQHIARIAEATKNEDFWAR